MPSSVPTQECDLVLKGGVTSGVVYPPAILKLAERYRFRSIGGASAGAIAAAATAAAEYGRQRRHALDELARSAGKTPTPALETEGFLGLKAVTDELSAPGFILGLFEPAGDARPLFELALRLKAIFKERSLLFKRALGVNAELVKQFPRAYRDGAAVGLGASALLGALWIRWAVGHVASSSLSDRLLGLVGLGACAAFLATGSILGAWIATAGNLVADARTILDPRHGYGICPGSRGAHAHADGRLEPLTDWLHARLNQLAGRSPADPPLSVGELSRWGIRFRSVTSNLTLGQPQLLPLQRGSRSFFFRRSQFALLFPKQVLDSLTRWASENGPSRIRLPANSDWQLCPMGEDLPLVVATRMSLSFPTLLQAVPLYSLSDAAYQASAANPAYVVSDSDFQPHWLSDGGIASNFPIHIFDTWVPDRPTFGLTLYDSPLSSPHEPRELTSEVVLPLPRDFDLARPPRVDLNGPLGFFRAIFNLAQSYRDTAQSGLPSYRERVVQIFMRPEQGGLNLDMPREVIDAIAAKGQEAAALLLQHFGPHGPTSFSEHLWVRLRVLLGPLESELLQLARPDIAGSAEGVLRRFDQIVEEQLASQPPWYRAEDKEWCLEARARIASLLALAEEWRARQAQWRAAHPLHQQDPGFFAENPPRPYGLLRITSDL